MTAKKKSGYLKRASRFWLSSQNVLFPEKKFFFGFGWVGGWFGLGGWVRQITPLLPPPPPWISTSLAGGTMMNDPVAWHHLSGVKMGDEVGLGPLSVGRPEGLLPREPQTYLGSDHQRGARYPSLRVSGM